MKKVGVLSLQGDFAAHGAALERAGAEPVYVREREQLDEIDGLIIPGGESTTMLKLLRYEGPVWSRCASSAARKPMFGTCAGAILMANEMSAIRRRKASALMDIAVERNAYGRQIDSRVVELEPRPSSSSAPRRASWRRCSSARRSSGASDGGRQGAGRVQWRSGAGGAGPPSGGHLSPGADRRFARARAVPGETVMPPLKTRVLFVCIGNACRSQMAEGFARAYGSDVLVPASAGLAPASGGSLRTRCAPWRKRASTCATTFRRASATWAARSSTWSST